MCLVPKPGKKAQQPGDARPISLLHPASKASSSALIFSGTSRMPRNLHTAKADPRRKHCTELFPISTRAALELLPGPQWFNDAVMASLEPPVSGDSLFPLTLLRPSIRSRGG